MNNQETMDLIEIPTPEELVVDDSPTPETDFPSEALDETTEEVASEAPPSEAVSEENDPPSPPLSREELCTEIERLRAELEETKSLHARMANELGEFHALFPDVNTASIPESIWEQVKNGIPLAASYALYEKKCSLRRQHAEEINLHNAKHTPGAAGKNTPAEYFSPDEVRRMSQSEVRSNYQKIMESMKKWNR